MSRVPSAAGSGAQIGIGPVRHRRLRPAANRFEYRSCFLLLPLRRLQTEHAPGLTRGRFGLLAFDDRDHGDGGPDALAWIEDLLVREGLSDADGEIWLQTYPRVLGHVFKPVSLWYCHRADGSLRAVLAEVNNTFGERHVYLLDGAGEDAGAPGRAGSADRQGSAVAPQGGPGVGWGRELRARKVFHVSPFCRVQGEYRFRFMRTADRLVARIDHHDDAGALLETSISGRLEPLTPASVRRAFFAMPLMSLAVVLRIHWQAVKLWVKRVPFFHKPVPPTATLSR